MTLSFGRIAVTVALTAIISACAAPPTYIRAGTEPVSVVDLREAKRTVTAYDSIPASATDVVDITAIRCHRTSGHPKPTEETVRDDLLVEAMAKERNGIADFKLEVGATSLSYNCWEVLTGTAKAFNTP